MLQYKVRAKIHVLDVTNDNEYSKLEVLEYSIVAPQDLEHCNEDYNNLAEILINDAIDWEGIKTGDVIIVKFENLVTPTYDAFTGEHDADYEIKTLSQEKSNEEIF